jgi:hypothetical protein
MNCHEFVVRLNDLLDERLPVGEDPTLRAHAAHCQQCRELWSAQQQMVEFFHRTRPKVRPEWSQQNQTVCTSQPPRRRFAFDMRWLAVAAVGVAATLVLMFSPAWPGNRKSEKETQVAMQGPQGEKSTPDDENGGMRLDQLFTWQQWAEHWPDSIEQIEQVEGLRPLRSSFSLAFHTLWRTFPGSREPRQKSEEGAQRLFGDRHLS